MSIGLTAHASQRIKERGNSRGKRQLDQSTKAFERGKDITEFSKEMQRYLYNVLANSSGDVLKVWGGLIWLFGVRNDRATLVTCFPVPQKLLRKENSRRN